ncbi:hypothetical protein [Shimia marina]|uniref:Uncharacterized protein n=1 Tax=Shimia marina TaxID=321267 RepID=A0A0P1EUK8_9RHOB|nr:hypothetical protein [Shimia marina]CUH54201.1 hypothetical protein SHM7688_03671 [Shimia marina]SFD97561.1 hypothetical protein SAMN04488037_10481 [Shimia marina]
MKNILCTLLAAAILIPFLPSETEAGTMTRACLRSDRDGATRSMCRCIQKVANQSLSRSDQKLAASFIKEPHKAQEIRQSDRRSHETFWLRYKSFGNDVTASCNHLR